MSQDLLARITINPDVCHGKPVIRNTRYLVEGIIEYMAGGDSVENILSEFNDLTREDILACLAFAARVIKIKDISLPAA